MYRLAQPLRVALAAFALAGSVALGQSQPKSPVGPTWDCLVSGARNGVAYMTFHDDGTFSGYEVLVPRPPASPVQALVSVAVPGNGLGPRPGPAPTKRMDLCGATPLNGTWGLDSRGRIVGSFLEVVYSTDCVATPVPVSTNLFESLSPLAETNQVPLSFSVTSTLSTNKGAGTFKNQTVSYLGQVPVSTNVFDAPLPISETNVFASGFSITLTTSTNTVVASYTELTRCYATNLVLSTTTFKSLTRLAATNIFPDGTFCIIRPVALDADGNYIEDTTCYLPVGLIGTNISETASLVLETNFNSDGTFCITAPIATNTVSGTYKNASIFYVLTENCQGLLTNVVNFAGTVVPGKRLALLGKSTLGGSTYRGVPAVALPNLSGPWRGLKQQNRFPAYEFFDLTDSPYAPNSYRVSGNGPGYSYNGLALLSSQKRIALACEVLAGTNYQSTRAVIGSFNARKATATAAGVEVPSGTLFPTNRLSFHISKRTSLP